MHNARRQNCFLERVFVINQERSEGFNQKHETHNVIFQLHATQNFHTRMYSEENAKIIKTKLSFTVCIIKSTAFLRSLGLSVISFLSQISSVGVTNIQTCYSSSNFEGKAFDATRSHIYILFLLMNPNSI